jgi:hypothetical protein
LGVRRWLGLEYTDPDPEALGAHAQQEELGWHLWVRGIQAEAWSEMMTQHYNETPDEDSQKCLGVTWHQKLILWMIQTAWALWIERNNQVHDKDEARRAQAAEQEMRRTYKLETEVEHPDRIIFQVSLEEQLRRPWRSIAAWITSTLPFIRRSIATRTFRTQNQHRDIRSFFRPAAPNNMTASNGQPEQAPNTENTTASSDQSEQAPTSGENSQTNISNHHSPRNQP